MNTEQKLEHFLNVSIQTANKKNEESFLKYKENLNTTFEDHKKEIQQSSKDSISNKKSLIKQTIRREYSSKESEVRRSLINERNSIKNQIFKEVDQLIDDFRKSEEYITYLEGRIKYIDSVIDDVEADIYVDSDDSHLAEKLEKKTGHKISVYNHNFSGGIRAIIPSKNILIDETIKTKIDDIYENYRLDY